MTCFWFTHACCLQAPHTPCVRPHPLHCCATPCMRPQYPEHANHNPCIPSPPLAWYLFPCMATYPTYALTHPLACTHIVNVCPHPLHVSYTPACLWITCTSSQAAVFTGCMCPTPPHVSGSPAHLHRLWPVLAVGFKDLLARSAAQSAALDENSQRLKSLNDLAHNLAKCVCVWWRHGCLQAKYVCLCLVEAQVPSSQVRLSVFDGGTGAFKPSTSVFGGGTGAFKPSTSVCV